MLLLPVQTLAAADTCTWDGSTSADWSDGTNWTGCDNGGVPEAGDTLTFPVGASNLSMNNDLGVLIFNVVNIFGTGYTFGGNDVSIQNSWNFYGAGNTVTSNINIVNPSSSSLLVNATATGNVIDGDIDLNLTAGGDMNFALNENINHNGIITGSTDVFTVNTGPSYWISSNTAGSTFTSNLVTVGSGGFQCRFSNCFGAVANPVATTGTGQINLSGGAIVIANDVTLGSSASPQLNNATGTNLISGALSVTSTGTIYVQPGSTLTQSGTVSLTSDMYILGSTAATTGMLISGVISGAGNVIANDISLNILSANGLYGGNFTAQSGAVIIPLTPTALGNTTGTTTIESGATLSGTTTITIAEPLIVEGSGEGSGFYLGAIVGDTNDPTFSGDITITGDTTFYSSGGANIILAGAISGTGNVYLESANASSFVTFDGSGANTYTGTTYVVDGELQLIKDPGVIAIPGNLVIDGTLGLSQVQINNAEQIANTANINMIESVAFNAQLQTDAETIGSLSGAGAIYIVQNTFNVGGDNSSTTYTGSITTNNIVPGIFNKQGTGTLTLSGTTSAGFEPNFTVSAGILKVMTNYSTSPFTANSGGTLKGTGQTGVTVIAAGGTFAAGTSPGCMTVASLTLVATSVFEQEIDGLTACSGYDQTTVTGAADLGGATLNTIPTFTPATGTVFTIIQAGSITGTFSGLADNAEFTANGIRFRINYTGTTVTLTVLGGTLASTGQPTAMIQYSMIFLFALSLAGASVVVWRRKKLLQGK